MFIDFDKNTLILTFIFSVLLVEIIITSIYFCLKISNSFYKYLIILGSIPILVILIFGYLLSPKKIVFEKDRLKIDRSISDVYIECSNIREVKILNSKEVLLNAKRIFASGGFWGYYGKFKSEKLGVYYLYARRSSGDYFLIRTSDKTYVLAPFDVNSFIKELKEKCKL